MSVLVIIKVPGDGAAFQEFFEANAEEVNKISQGARAMGCTHHVFSTSGNEVVAVDHWDSRDSFEKFFSAPEIAAIMSKSGATGPPSVEFFDVLDTIDSF